MKFKYIAYGLMFFAIVFGLLRLPSSAVDADGKIVVVLDPGHGGIDPGAGANGISEAKPALRLAWYIKEYLEQNGNFSVYLTRTDDNTNLILYERGAIADSYHADICVSLHFNSVSPSTYRGATVCTSVLDQYAMPELSDMILNRLRDYLGIPKNNLTRTEDYGKHLLYWSDPYQWDIPDTTSFGAALSDYYGMIKWSAKFGFYGIIIEHCCISNQQDAEIVKSEEKLKLMAKADADALIAYYTGHVHQYASEKTVDYPSSCLFPGKASYRCTVCGCRKDTSFLHDGPDPDKHFWYLSETKAPGCEAEGYKKYTCRFTENMIELYHDSYSEKHEKIETIAALGHSYALVNEIAPGHSKNGEKIYCCSRCGKTYSVSIPASGEHSFQLSETKEPTCTEEGYHRYACSCGESYDEKIPPKGHSLKTMEEPPTCESAGKMLTVCEICGYVCEELLLQPLGHEFAETSDAFYSYRKCVRCSETDSLQTLPVPATVASESDISTQSTAVTKKEQTSESDVRTGTQSDPSRVRSIILIAGAAAIFTELIIGAVLIRRCDRKKPEHSLWQ